MDGKTVNQFANLSSYAEKMLVHENALVKIKESFPLDRAALIGCGVITGVGAAINTAKVTPGSTVAVWGAGGVGLAVIQGARIAGARQIIVVDKFEQKIALAKKLGATHGVDASSGDPVEAVRSLSNGGVDFSFEAIGLKKAAEQAYEALAPGGTGHHRRDGAARAEGGHRRLLAAVREAHPGMLHGLEPLPHRHAAAHRVLRAGAAQPR